MATGCEMSLLPTHRMENLLTPSDIEDLLKLKHSLPVTAEKPYNTETQVDKDWARDFVRTRFPELDSDFEICYSHFLNQTLPYIIHTDGPLSLDMKGYFNILIPLEINGSAAHTVTFEQSFSGKGRAFVKGVTDDELEVYDLTKDYADVENLSSAHFPKEAMTSHLDHIEAASLEGLSLEKIMDWRIGDAILFDRYRLHSSSSFKKFGLKDKTSLIIATRHS